MWMEVNLALSPQAEGNLFGSSGRGERVFRKTLAALSTSRAIGLPPAFFGYGDDGKADSRGHTCIGMGCTAGGLRLVAVGSGACALLSDKVGSIHYALMLEAEALIPMHQHSGEHMAKLLPFEKPYYIKSLAVGKTDKDNPWFRASKAVQDGSDWMTQGAEKIPRSIGLGLIQQALILGREGDDIEGNFAGAIASAMVVASSMQEAEFKLLDRLGVRLHSIGGHTYDRVGPVGSRLVLKHVEFSMMIDLAGAWFAGRQKIDARGQFITSSRVAQGMAA